MRGGLDHRPHGRDASLSWRRRRADDDHLEVDVGVAHPQRHQAVSLPFGSALAAHVRDGAVPCNGHAPVEKRFLKIVVRVKQLYCEAHPVVLAEGGLQVRPDLLHVFGVAHYAQRDGGRRRRGLLLVCRRQQHRHRGRECPQHNYHEAGGACGVCDDLNSCKIAILVFPLGFVGWIESRVWSFGQLLPFN